MRGPPKTNFRAPSRLAKSAQSGLSKERLAIKWRPRIAEESGGSVSPGGNHEAVGRQAVELAYSDSL